jgi:YVTN family beta-propeller protein
METGTQPASKRNVFSVAPVSCSAGPFVFSRFLELPRQALSPWLTDTVALMNEPNMLLISIRPKTLLLVLWLISFSTPPGLAQTQADNSAVQNRGLPKNEVVATIPVGSSPEYAVVSPDSKTVYVSNDLSNTISVINAATNTVTFTIPVSSNPDSVAITPDGRTLYVVCFGFGSVAVIDTLTNIVTSNLGAGQVPGTIAVSPNGKLAYVPSGSEIVIFDPTTNEYLPAIDPRFPLDAFDVVFAPDSSRAFVLAATENSLRCGILGIDTSTQRVQRLVWGELHDALSLTISPDGETLYVGAVVRRSGVPRTEIAVYDIQDEQIKKRILLPGANSPGGGQSAITPDGRYLYFPHGQVIMIDTVSDRIVGPPISVGSEPFSVAIAPNGKTAYSVNAGGSGTGGTGTVSVIDISPQL